MDASMISRSFFVSLIFVIGLIFESSHAMEDEKNLLRKALFNSPFLLIIRIILVP